MEMKQEQMVSFARMTVCMCVCASEKEMCARVKKFLKGHELLEYIINSVWY